MDRNRQPRQHEETVGDLLFIEEIEKIEAYLIKKEESICGGPNSAIQFWEMVQQVCIHQAHRQILYAAQEQQKGHHHG